VKQVEGAAYGWYEAYGGWYEAAEEGPDPAAEQKADAIADADGEEAVHEREMAKLKVAIEERLVELTREAREHGLSPGRSPPFRRPHRPQERAHQLPAASSSCPRPTGAPMRRLRRRRSAGKSGGITSR
jgi:hypothetical protein